MARSDWGKTIYGHWRRSDGMAFVVPLRDGLRRRMCVIYDRPEGGGPILAAKRRFTKTAAMDYADTHYPMEKK